MSKLYSLFLIILVICTLASCASSGNSQLPLTLNKISSGKPTSDLLVMFPGINSPGTDFIQHGFVSMFQHRYPDVDIILVDTRFAYIKDDNIAERIQNEIILPARRDGYKKIGFTGISLGGLSALKYSKTFAGNLDGIVLIAPYLGEQSAIEDLLASRAPFAWSELNTNSRDKTIRLWRYLLNKTQGKKSKDRLFIAYGESDRFSDMQRFLASLLDKNNVFTEKGGHNWTVWKKLWQTMLDKKIFDY